MLRLPYWLVLCVACTSSTSEPTPDGAIVAERCTSSHEQTHDPQCGATPNLVAAFESFHPTRGASHGVPAAYFPTPIEHAVLTRPEIAIDSCGTVASSAPACGLCAENQYCHPDGTCQATPYAGNHDVGAIEISVDNTPVGTLAVEGGTYAPQGELATRIDPIWQPGQKVRATNAAFEIEGIGPAVPNVSTFIHSVDPQEIVWGADFALQWNAGAATDVLEITVGSQFAYVRCAAADDGSFSIPWRVFTDTNNLSPGEMFVFVDRVRRAVAPSALGKVSLIMRASDSQQIYSRQR